MDTIYDYLKADHKKVANLFKLFEDDEKPEAKLDYVYMICKELLVHAEAEEKTFYKELEKFPQSDEDAVHGEKEHSQIEQKIAEINALSKPNKQWEEKVLELKKLVEHHVSDEEGKMFRHAKKVLSDEQAFVIREQMHDLKEKILTRLDSIAKKQEIIS